MFFFKQKTAYEMRISDWSSDVCSSDLMTLPEGWALGNGALRLIGAAMVLAGLAYLYLCGFSSTRSWTLRGHEIELPTLGLAVIQISIAMLNWVLRSEEHTYELQSLMRISYAGFCLKKKRERSIFYQTFYTY